MRASSAIARAAGISTRVYVPFGEPSLPYGFGDVRGNPGIALRILRDTVLGRSLRLRVAA